MKINSPQFNLMYKACIKASKTLIRDFGEIEKLQVSEKGPGDFVTASDKRIEKIIIDAFVIILNLSSTKGAGLKTFIVLINGIAFGSLFSSNVASTRIFEAIFLLKFSGLISSTK